MFCGGNDVPSREFEATCRGGDHRRLPRVIPIRHSAERDLTIAIERSHFVWTRQLHGRNFFSQGLALPDLSDRSRFTVARELAPWSMGIAMGIPVQNLHVGMQVRHPRYGVGTIKALTEHTADI